MLIEDFEIIQEKYEDAKRLYNNGIFMNSKDILLSLVLQKPIYWEFWFSLAATFQQLKNYTQAIIAYNMVLVLDSNNASAFFYLAESFLSINKKLDAFKALDKAEKLCNNDLLKDQILILKKQNSLQNYG